MLFASFLNAHSLKGFAKQEGEFSFAMPLEGWWGFAALIDDDQKIKHEGKEYPVELGAVIWVQTKEYK